MHGTPTDPSALPRGWPGAAAAILVVSVAALLVATSLAGLPKQVDNPHGDFKEDCALCHDARGWTPARVSPKFDHGARYGFRLAGAHAAAACLDCHKTLEFKQSKVQCASCHEDPHRGEMGLECARCHSDRSFVDRGAMMRNHQLTRFPLSGAHAALECESCHPAAAQGHLQFVGTQARCVDCHRADYDRTTAPDHRAGGYPLECASCHAATTWTSARFDHARTAFPLTGAHRAAACERCHGDGVFRGKSGDCVTCHRADYDATTGPVHATAGFGTQCASCHGTASWGNGGFDHSQTQFPLTGAHRNTACTGCHGDGVYDGKNTACLSCHQTDYNATTSPAHAAAGYSTQCTSCHNTTAWLGATFDHATTAFPLTGAHRAAACNSCHGDGVYGGKSTACVSCHQTDYNTTADPPHQAAGFSTACNTCHNTTAWPGATFNHATTAFPLTGAHVAAACNSCHGDGVYGGKNTACLSCHQTDYNGTTNPPHASAGFSTACQTCHTTITWDGATFDHDATFFRIYSGKHRGRWSACADCHPNSTNYSQFNCLSCHPHSDRTETDNHHRGESGYSYTSSACYTCHRRV